MIHFIWPKSCAVLKPPLILCLSCWAMPPRWWQYHSLQLQGVQRPESWRMWDVAHCHSHTERDSAAYEERELFPHYLTSLHFWLFSNTGMYSDSSYTICDNSHVQVIKEVKFKLFADRALISSLTFLPFPTQHRFLSKKSSLRNYQ